MGNTLFWQFIDTHHEKLMIWNYLMEQNNNFYLICMNLVVIDAGEYVIDVTSIVMALVF